MTAPTVQYWPLGRAGEAPVSSHVAYEDEFQAMAQFWRPTGVLPYAADDFLGLYPNPLRVTANSSGMQVLLEPGRAWIKGAYLEVDDALASYTLAISAAHATLGRMDRVVARLDKSTAPSTAGIYVKTGTPNATPATGLPTLTQTDSVWEIGLATVLVDAAAVTIAAGKVTDERIYSLWATRDIAANAITQTGAATGSTSGPTTASASYADLANMSVTLTTVGGDLLVDFDGTFSHSTAVNSVFIAFSLDAAAEVHERYITSPGVNYGLTFHLRHRFTGVSAASHTVKVRWKTDGGTATAVTTLRDMIVTEQKK